MKRLKVGFNVPVYVLEYLLGKYCSTTKEEEIRAGLEQVKSAISERIVRGDQSELIKARLQRSGSLKLIDLVSVVFDEKVTGGGNSGLGWRHAAWTRCISARRWFTSTSGC